MRTPKLKRINLNKICGRDGCDHPDIKQSVFYLVKYDNRFYAGEFTRQWYGWNFGGIYIAGAQLKDIGFQDIWQIIR